MNENTENPKPESDDIPQPTPPQEPTPMQSSSSPQQPEETTPPVQETAPPPEYSESAPPIPPQEPAPQAETPQPASDISQDSKNMGMLCHLLGLFTSFVGPLILWLIKKDEDKFVDSQGKEALNFQITVAISMTVSMMLIPVFIGLLLVPAVQICNLVFCILASVATSKGEDYRYPWALRLVK